MRAVSSFDHLVGAGEQRRRHPEIERLCSDQVDDQFELRGLLDRQIARLRPAQNLVDVLGRAVILVHDVWSVGH